MVTFLYTLNKPIHVYALNFCFLMQDFKIK